MIYRTILETIGRTPLVRLNRLPGTEDAQMLAKLESFNPGGSVKDRIALNMIESAEHAGVLQPGQTIIEPTSGNTGIGLAMVAAVKGYRLIVTMPETMTRERRALMQQFGAEIILTPGEQGMKGAIAEATRLADEQGYFMPRQFENPANPDVHRRTTAREILTDLDGDALDYFVAGVGTGGTVSGTGEVLKQVYPELRVIAVEPEDSPVLSGGAPGPHKIPGIGAGFIPKNYNPAVVDDIIRVSNHDAYHTARRLASEEGILAGISSGANVFAALKLARDAGKGKRIVVIVCDTGERYVSTDLFEIE